MGIDWNTAQFLVKCRSEGVCFNRTVTLGRQNLFVPGLELQKMLGQAHIPIRSGLDDEFADGFLRHLGAEELLTIDASAYEGADVVHDMNRPLNIQDAPLSGGFDVVFDGGTLEHVFNFPIAMANCLSLVRVGGYLILQTPANNFCGHGFYQFSPELFFRVLSSDNGFVVKKMVAYECYEGGPWYEVADPAKVGHRVELASGARRVLLLVVARKLADVRVFEKVPQQSDYTVKWEAKALPSNLSYESMSTPLRQRHKLVRIVRSLIGKVVRTVVRTESYAARKAAKSGRRLSIASQPTEFKPITLDDLLVN